MKAALELKAEVRTSTGTGSARAARRAGFVPVNLYAKGEKNQALSVESRVLSNEYFRGGFMNKVIALQVDGKNLFAIPREIALNPVTDKIEHADFIAVNEKSIVKVFVPIHFLNPEKSVGIKRGGVLNIVRHDIELFAPVKAIPSHIDIDIAEMDIGHSVHIDAVKLPEGVSTVIKGRNFTIASVAGRQKEEEEIPTAAPVAAGEVPAITAKLPDGTPAPAGAAPAAAGAAAGAAPAKGAAPAADKPKK